MNKQKKVEPGVNSVNRGRLPRTMQLLVCSSLLVFLGMLFLVPYSWPDHRVGEPKLEQLRIWEQCCRDHDCIPQRVKIIGTAGNGKIPIEVEKYQTLVKKREIFSLFPLLILGFAISTQMGKSSTKIFAVFSIPNIAGQLLLLVEAWSQLLLESVLKILASNKATTFPHEKLPALRRAC